MIQLIQRDIGSCTLNHGYDSIRRSSFSTYMVETERKKIKNVTSLKQTFSFKLKLLDRSKKSELCENMF